MIHDWSHRMKQDTSSVRMSLEQRRHTRHTQTSISQRTFFTEVTVETGEKHCNFGMPSSSSVSYDVWTKRLLLSLFSHFMFRRCCYVLWDTNKRKKGFWIWKEEDVAILREEGGKNFILQKSWLTFCETTVSFVDDPSLHLWCHFSASVFFTSCLRKRRRRPKQQIWSPSIFDLSFFNFIHSSFVASDQFCSSQENEFLSFLSGNDRQLDFSEEECSKALVRLCFLYYFSIPFPFWQNTSLIPLFPRRSNFVTELHERKGHFGSQRTTQWLLGRQGKFQREIEHQILDGNPKKEERAQQTSIS